MCRHTRTTFPMTPRSGIRAGRTYVTCLNCGADFDYDWKNMKLGSQIDAPSSGPALPHVSPTIKQMLLAPFQSALPLYRLTSKWFARHVLPHIIHPFPHWHSR